jgi:hypothetical protein
MALHLLSTAGTWWITDHGEILAVAERLLTTGHLDLADLGPGFEDWTRIVAARSASATRFLPLSIVLLTPFLALDHLFGWRDPASFRFVYLQGHVFVGLGLVLAGRHITRATGNASTGALSILLLGLNWPVWMIARRLGPEPVLFALLALFATGGFWRRFICMILLPWVHASGPLLGLGLGLALAVEDRSSKGPSIRGAFLGWLLGVASVAFLWNLPIHGHLVLGGYNDYSTDGFFHLRNPLFGLAVVARRIVVWTLPLVYLAVLRGRGFLPSTVALWAPAVAFLSVFSNPEPERRLAPLLAAWTVALMTHAAPLGRERATVLVVLSLVSGVTGLARDFVDTVATPLGVFSGPILLFLHMAFVEGRPYQSLGFVLSLSALAVLAGRRTLGLILDAPEAVGPKRLSPPDSLS